MWAWAGSFVAGVLGLAGMAEAQTLIAGSGFNSTEDVPYFTAGDLGGQGSASNGWAAPWATVSTSGLEIADRYLVVAGGSPANPTCSSDSPGDPDQHLRMFGSPSSSYLATRLMTPWSGDFVFQYDMKLTLDGGILGGGQIQLEDTNTGSTGKRPLNLKLQLGGFYVNDQLMLPYTGRAGFQSMVGNWVTVKVVCDWESQTFDLYWTNDTDGCLAYVGRKVGWKDALFVGPVQKLRIDALKVSIGTDGAEMDRILLVTAPPPGPCDTVVLLNSGTEVFTAVTGGSPIPIVYALHNGGSLDHNYQLDETAAAPHGISGLFNTGVDGSGVPLGDQALDPHYALTMNPDAAGTAAYTAKDDGFPIPPWIANSPTSRWITVRADDGDAVGAAGQYVYRTTFTAPGSDKTLFGLVAGDNTISDILVDGVSTGIRDSNMFLGWTPFQLKLGASDDALDIVVTNAGSTESPTGVRAEFFDLVASDASWLSLDTANPIAVTSQTSRGITAMVDPTGLPVGVYSAYLRFKNTDDCDPPNNSFEDPIVRRIQMTLTNWGVTPAGLTSDVPVSAGCPGRPPQTVQFTVTNLGATGDLTYTVAKGGAAAWLTLDKSGPIVVAPGTGDVVSGTIDPTGLAAGTYVCPLVFTEVGTSLPKEVRTVTLHVTGTVWEYGGDVNPEDPDSAGPGLNFTVHAETPMPVNQGQVEDDPLATDGKVWRLTDSGTAKTKFRSQPNTWVSGQLGATLVARVRVHTLGPDTSQGLALGIWDDVTGDSVDIFYSGDEGLGAGIIKEMRRNQTAAVAGDNQFHVIRVTVKGTAVLDRTINVYFDENPTPVLSMVQASNSVAGIDGFVFGAGSTAGQIDMAFDWLTATDVGAFAPGEEYACLGRSLVLDFCPKPFADADEDGDVDQVDYAAFQRCFTGDSSSAQYDAEQCHCFDRDHDGDIGEFDLRLFVNCASGPDVPWSEATSPDCEP